MRASAAGLAGVLLLALGLAGCRPAGQPGRADPAQPARPTYETILADTTAAIAEAETQTKGALQSAMMPVELVGLYTERAKLTGGYEDYARAEALLARLETQFGNSDRVCLAKARLHYTLHRLAQAKQVLDGCPRLAGTPEDLGLRADIAFYTGRYKDAGIIYRTLVDQLGTPQAYIQLAMYSAKTGAPGEATAFLEAAEKRYHGGSAVMQSWLALQRGLIELDRGRYDEARALYALADERMPGYWLNEEHAAEIAALKGDAAGAKRIYEDVVRKTGGAPEFLDALGGLEADAGNAKAAKAHFDRAEAIYAERFERFPEASAGHALDHYLDDAPQPAKALALAEANYRNRPFGDAAVGLAKALLLNARSREAVRLLEDHIARGWNTAEIHWTLSLAAKASGDAARARTAAQEATRRNANAATQYDFEF